MSKTKKTTAATGNKDAAFAFGKENYMWMLGGIVLIIIGYILMSGGKPEDPSVFNPEVFNARRLYVAPLLVLLGHAVVFYAIVKKSKE